MLRRHWLLVLCGMLCVPAHAAVSLWMPRLMGTAIDALVPSDPGSVDGGGTLAAACQLLLLLALLESATRYVSRRTLIDASRLVEEELKNDVLRHLQQLPIAWYDRARTGDLVSRLTQDVELVRFVMGPLLLHGGSALCLLPGGIWLMAQMSLPVTLVCGAVFALLFGFLRLLLPRLQHWSKQAQAAIGDLSQRVQEDFAGIRVLQQFGAQQRELAALARRNRRSLAFNLRLVRLRSLMHAVTHSTTGILVLGVLLVGGNEVIAGAMTIGDLFQFTSYLAMMTFPLEVLGWTLATMPRALAAAQRIDEIMQVEPETRAGLQLAVQGHLEVRDLSFTYPGKQEPALRNVSFVLAPGRKLGIVGPVGSGKSTLLALCLRLYEPPRGAILLDGHDVLDLHPMTVRSAFAFAPQEPFLFSDTIANNVVFGREAAAEPDDLDLAVSAAALDQDLPQLQHGLLTTVGERGVTLSGGQKQRVSLARALHSERSALLLDDTLSAVDMHTERRILAGLQQSRRGRTMLIASHRLSVLTDADEILVLDRGRVVERGSHRELLARGGVYAAAFRRQQEASALEQGGAGGPP